MAYEVLRWPLSVYPDEVKDECPEAMPVIDVLIRQMRTQGPQPVGYHVKNLGAQKDGLWQINLKIEKRQVRILYAPYKSEIVLFRIHKKSSSQEQERAYTLAMRRKREYEQRERNKNDKRTLH